MICDAECMRQSLLIYFLCVCANVTRSTKQPNNRTNERVRELSMFSASIVKFNMMIMFLSATVRDLCVAERWLFDGGSGLCRLMPNMIACFIVPPYQVGVDISHS